MQNLKYLALNAEILLLNNYIITGENYIKYFKVLV